MYTVKIPNIAIAEILDRGYITMEEFHHVEGLRDFFELLKRERFLQVIGVDQSSTICTFVVDKERVGIPQEIPQENV
jgi:hypothetical protein